MFRKFFVRKCAGPFQKQSLTCLVAQPVTHEDWRKRRSKCSESGSVSAFNGFDPDTDSDADPDGFWLRLFSEQGTFPLRRFEILEALRLIYSNQTIRRLPGTADDA